MNFNYKLTILFLAFVFCLTLTNAVDAAYDNPLSSEDGMYRYARAPSAKWMRFGKRSPQAKWMRFGKRSMDNLDFEEEKK